VTDKTNGPLLDRARIQELLNELGRRCAAHGISAEILIAGGGAIALAYSNDRATRDIDAIFEPKMLVYQEAESMANELGLPRDWLNDAVKGFMPDFPDDGRQVTTASEGIHVVIPSAEYLFAMKATSARIGVDDDDLRLLGGIIGITTPEQAYALVERFYRRERISAKSGFFIQSIFPEGHDSPL
jgi:hypothetical protein